MDLKNIDYRFRIDFHILTFKISSLKTLPSDLTKTLKINNFNIFISKSFLLLQSKWYIAIHCQDKFPF